MWCVRGNQTSRTKGDVLLVFIVVNCGNFKSLRKNKQFELWNAIDTFLCKAIYQSTAYQNFWVATFILTADDAAQARRTWPAKKAAWMDFRENHKTAGTAITNGHYSPLRNTVKMHIQTHHNTTKTRLAWMTNNPTPWATMASKQAIRPDHLWKCSQSTRLRVAGWGWGLKNALTGWRSPSTSAIIAGMAWDRAAWPKCDGM